MSAADYWPLAVAVRFWRRRWWLRVAGRAAGVGESDLELAADRLRKRLEEGPMRRSELEALVGKPMCNGVGLWVDMVRAPPSGTWERRRADLFASAEDWIGPPAVGAEQALEHLVRRYLGGFGPSAPSELADWAGLPVAEIVPVLERLPLRRFRGEDGDELFDLRRAPLPDPATPAPVRFLPTWDTMLLVHARRKQVIAEEHRPLVFSSKTPQSIGTFLVDGTVAGTWRHRDGRVQVDPFGPLPASARQELHEEAARLAAFHA